jgi:phosphate uptake regulator
METRKVQITGRSTYTISLPKKWVNKVKIRNGDSIGLIPLSEGTLLLSPKLDEKGERLTRSIDMEPDDTDQFYRKFIGLYLAGYNQIEMKFNSKPSKKIKNMIRKLSYTVIGPEIIDETADTVTIKDFSDASDFSLVKGVKRMYIIVRSMYTDAFNAIKEHDLELAGDIESRDDEVDKLYWFIAKQYNLILRDVFFADKIGVGPQKALGYLLIARSIERIGDHATKLAKNAANLEKDTPIINDLVDISEDIRKILDAAINAFYWNKFEDANEVIIRSKNVMDKIEKLKQKILGMKNETRTIVSLVYIVDSLERTRSYAEDIAETAINHFFLSES